MYVMKPFDQTLSEPFGDFWRHSILFVMPLVWNNYDNYYISDTTTKPILSSFGYFKKVYPNCGMLPAIF